MLNNSFRDALELMENSESSLFITGRAGTGKSTLLKLFKTTTKKNVVVLAPTGVAALNVGGQTIHSFFKFPPRLLEKSGINKLKYRKLYTKLDIIVIDEISMVRADMLDNIDYFLQVNRGNPLPFGGVKMIFIGDLYQIPPVVKQGFEMQYLAERYETPYFFSSNVLSDRDFPLELLELHEIFRQEDKMFINLLESIRTNDVDFDILEQLNSRHIIDYTLDDGYIILSSRNNQVNKINKDKIDALPYSNIYYQAEITGEFPESIFPTDAILTLKEGAQVMFIRNDTEKNYVNGTIGTIKSLTPDKIMVEIASKNETKTIEVAKETWDNIKYSFDDKDSISEDIVGTFKQYPLKLAWAITIHKSQGKTFDNVIIDMSAGAFTHGMTYVALSRCTSLEGIILKAPLKPSDIIVDENIVSYLETMRRY
ncbi:MAG: AAA family ATPase [Saprospiraceae bacterium]